MLVYVTNKHGKPLMPCKPRKARKLLKQGKAKVVKRTPFTIQLLYGSTGYKQEVILGVDAGSKYIGISATTDKQELFSAEVELRSDIVDLVSIKRQNRRTRRNSGFFDIRTLCGEKVNKGSINCNKLELSGFRKNMLWERRMAIPPLP